MRMDEARATPEGLLAVMDSLGDPTRLRLLRLLDCCSCRSRP